MCQNGLNISQVYVKAVYKVLFCLHCFWMVCINLFVEMCSMVRVLMYADAMFSDSPADLQKMIEKLYDCCKIFSLEVNVLKFCETIFCRSVARKFVSKFTFWLLIKYTYKIKTVFPHKIYIWLRSWTPRSIYGMEKTYMMLKNVHKYTLHV